MKFLTHIASSAIAALIVIVALFILWSVGYAFVTFENPIPLLENWGKYDFMALRAFFIILTLIIAACAND